MRVTFDRFTFDADTRELLENGRRVHISPKAFDVLRMLLERRPKVVSKTDLHDRVWSGAFVGDANISVVVAEIRHVLGDDSKDAQFIRTVHRVGYAFCGDVREVSGSTGTVRRGPPCRCWLTWNGNTYPLASGENVVGRDPRSDVWIDASGVSRRHALIAVLPDRVTIEDLGSSNGTFLRGKRIRSPQALEDGDAIDLGATSISFRQWSDEQGPKTERLTRP